MTGKEMDVKEFEGIIEKVLENLPEKFKKKLKNISIIIEENMVSPLLEHRGPDNSKYVLGLYQGLPLTLQAGSKNIFPHRITLYKKNIEAVSKNKQEVEKNTRRVMLHELGHYFGLDEGKLEGLGY